MEDTEGGGVKIAVGGLKSASRYLRGLAGHCACWMKEVLCLERQLATVTKERDELKAQDAIHWKTRRALLASNKALADELSDHEKVVEMTIAADLCGIERWQAATGKELTHPDKGQLVTWLLEQWDASKAEVERLKAERYLPIDCPNCGRRRLCYWPEKNECECDKCGYSTEAAARDAKENSDG